jgi:hypothetical protein
MSETVAEGSQMNQRKDTRWHLWQAEQWIRDRVAADGQIPLSLMPPTSPPFSSNCWGRGHDRPL